MPKISQLLDEELSSGTPVISLTFWFRVRELILLFRHPIAGVQLVKGTIETGETPAQTALRELSEESGIVAASIVSDMGCWDAAHLDQIWSFQLCCTQALLPEQWTHHTLDDRK
ncbi:MAG: NUDIX domain-containing protein, partial [Pseudomonas sp.]